MLASMLETLQAFLEREVAQSICLKEPDNENTAAFHLTHPRVHIGWIPPKTDSREYDVPCLVVGVSGVEDDGDWRRLGVTLSAVVYSPGLVLPDGSYRNSFDGYLDLINLLDRTAAALKRNRYVGNLLIEQDTLSWRMDEEQGGDFWTGKVEFEVKAPPYPNMNTI